MASGKYGSCPVSFRVDTEDFTKKPKMAPEPEKERRGRLVFLRDHWEGKARKDAQPFRGERRWGEF